MNPFSWASPTTVPQAAQTASTVVAEAMVTPGGLGSAVVKAGGIDVLDLMKEGLLAPATLVNLATVTGLDDVANDRSSFRIGAMITLAQLADHSLIRRHYPALAEAAEGAASPQIRNVATLGGNLLQRPRCWYFRSRQFHCLRKGGGHCFAIAGENQYHAIFDNQTCAIVHPSTTATVLVALGARVELTRSDGSSRTLLLEDFFIPPQRNLQSENDLRPHEILTSVQLPMPSASLHMAHVRQSEKDCFDWPLADVAVTFELSPERQCLHASVVLGAAAPLPYRAAAAERLLTGRRIDTAVAARAAKATLEGATPLSKNTYKLALFETLVRRAVLKAGNV